MKKHFGMLLVCLAAWQSPIRATDYVFTRLFVGEWDSRSNQPTIPTYTIADSGTVVFQTVYSSAGGAWPGTGPATFTTYLGACRQHGEKGGHGTRNLALCGLLREQQRPHRRVA